MNTLRPYQVDMLAALRVSVGVHRKRSPVLYAPTGAGKTVLAIAITHGVVAKALKDGRKPKICFCTPYANSLVNQTLARFLEQGLPDLGIVQGGRASNSSASVQICSSDTVLRRAAKGLLDHMPIADIVFFDECHLRSKLYEQWINHPRWRKTVFIGLSATPWARGMGKVFDDLVVTTSTAALTALGVLVPLVAFAPSHPNLKGVRIVGGDFHEGQLSERMRKPKLIADAATSWLQHGEGRPTIVYAVDCAHARALHKQFLAVGIPTEYCDADTPAEEREALLDRMQRGELKVVVNVNTLIMGLDRPFISCISNCRPTRSEMRFVQMIGRGLRTSPETGKVDCLLLDHSDTCLTLGLPSEIHHDKLDDGVSGPASSKRKKRPEALPKECPKCTYLKPPRTPVCPKCGFEPKRQTNIQHGEGELAPLSGKAKVWDRATKQRWYSELRSIQVERGRQDGWVSHKFREKFGVWPRDLSDEPVQASAEVRSWVRSRDIAYAKSKQRRSEEAHP